MNLSARFSAALAALSPELVAEDGYCAVTVDARLVVHLALDEASGDVVLWSNFPLMGEGEALMQRLLHANFFWQGTAGGCWSMDPESGIPMLAERMTSAQWDSPAFDGMLQRFADRAMASDTELGNSANPVDRDIVPGPSSADSFSPSFLRA